MDLSPIQKLSSYEEPSDLAYYSFSDYARDHYQEGSPNSHCRQLCATLHDFRDQEENEEAALTIFIVIQRFMMDLPEPKEGTITEEDNVFEQTLQRNAHMRRRNTGTFKRKMDSVKEPGWQSLPELSLMSKPTSNITKVRFICGYGMFRPELRDEIYNQICLQLTENSSSTSSSRGWILMALCLGCFPPSNKFLNFLRNFLKQGPEGYGEYCRNRLQRTLVIGNRKLAPTFIEMHAVKVQGKVMLPVTTMDGKKIKYEVDSSTTCEELLQQFQKDRGLKNLFGFSVFARVFNEVFSWGSGQENVMDVISLCEQYAQHKNLLPEEIGGNWSIFIRKEIFLPSHSPSSDPVETDLIYNQVVGGIKMGEYICDTDVELADFLARRYYVEHGTNFDDNLAEKLMERSAPDSCMESNHKQMEMIGLIRDTINTTPTLRAATDKDAIKQEVVSLAKAKWSRDFSKIINATVISGRKIPKGEVKVFLNSKGIDFLSVREDRESFFMSLDFEYVSGITSDSPKNIKHADPSSFVSIQNFDKKRYVLKSVGAVELKKIGNILLDDYRKGDPLSSQIGCNTFY